MRRKYGLAEGDFPKVDDFKEVLYSISAFIPVFTSLECLSGAAAVGFQLFPCDFAGFVGRSTEHAHHRDTQNYFCIARYHQMGSR